MAGRAHATEPKVVDLDNHREVEQVVPKPGDPDITADENARDALPVHALRPSQVYVEAQREQDAGDYAGAAPKWHQIVQRVSGDDLGHREIAEYQLGIALAHLGLLHASAFTLRNAAEQVAHSMHRFALVQLGEIAQELPELWSVLPLLAAYSLSDLEHLSYLRDAEKSNLAHLVGRGRYAQGDYREAQQAFARIDVTHPKFLEARLFESACHVRLRHSVPALTSLRRGTSAIERRDVRVRDRQRWLDLFHLSEARIYYSSAIALDLETNIPTINSSRLNAAVKYYNMLEPESEYYPEATFELAWVHFMAGQYTFALGKVFTLDSPFFQDDFHPEAQILRNVVYYANCNYDAVAITSARFNKQFIPIRDELKKLLKHAKESEAGRLVRVLDELRRRSGGLAPALASTVRAVFRDRGFSLRLRAAEAIEVEVATFERLPAKLKASGLGEELRGQLGLRRQEASDRAEQWLHGFLQRRIDEIDEHVRNGEKMLMMPADPSRNLLDVRLKTGQVSKVESNDWGRVRGDEEHVIWPFDGEYWRDELGTYRATVLSACGR